MTSSGITVSDEVTTAYNEMKLSHTWQLLTLTLNSDSTQVVKNDNHCMATCTYEEFYDVVDTNFNGVCSFFVLEYDNKLILIKWTPDTAKAAKKMVYASTFHTVKSTLEGVKTVEASDADDISESKLSSATY